MVLGCDAILSSYINFKVLMWLGGQVDNYNTLCGPNWSAKTEFSWSAEAMCCNILLDQQQSNQSLQNHTNQKCINLLQGKRTQVFMVKVFDSN